MKANKKGYTVSVSTGLLLLGLVAIVIVSTPCVAQAQASAEEFPAGAAMGAAAIAIIVIFAAFLVLLYLGCRGDHNLDKGEFRRAVAGSFVVGFSIIAILSFVFNVLREFIIPAYIELVGIVIGFYFGQRTVETAKET